MFVGRNIDGSIYGTWTCVQPQDAAHPRMEELPDTHPDVVAFLARVAPVSTAPTVGDLQTALIAKGVLTPGDITNAATVHGNGKGV